MSIILFRRIVAPSQSNFPNSLDTSRCISKDISKNSFISATRATLSVIFDNHRSNTSAHMAAGQDWDKNNKKNAAKKPRKINFQQYAEQFFSWIFPRFPLSLARHGSITTKGASMTRFIPCHIFFLFPRNTIGRGKINSSVSCHTCVLSPTLTGLNKPALPHHNFHMTFPDMVLQKIEVINFPTSS